MRKKKKKARILHVTTSGPPIAGYPHRSSRMYMRWIEATPGSNGRAHTSPLVLGGTTYVLFPLTTLGWHYSSGRLHLASQRVYTAMHIYGYDEYYSLVGKHVLVKERIKNLYVICLLIYVNKKHRRRMRCSALYM